MGGLSVENAMHVRLAETDRAVGQAHVRKLAALRKAFGFAGLVPEDAVNLDRDEQFSHHLLFSILGAQSISYGAGGESGESGGIRVNDPFCRDYSLTPVTFVKRESRCFGMVSSATNHVF